MAADNVKGVARWWLSEFGLIATPVNGVDTRAAGDVLR